jgi:hypothetical protein
VKLNVVSQVDTMLCHSLLIRMLQMDMTLTLLQPDVTSKPHLPSVQLTAFTVYTPGVLSPRSSFTGQRKLDIFLGGMPTDLMCWDSTLLMWLNIDKV